MFLNKSSASGLPVEVDYITVDAPRATRERLMAAVRTVLITGVVDLQSAGFMPATFLCLTCFAPIRLSSGHLTRTRPTVPSSISHSILTLRRIPGAFLTQAKFDSQISIFMK